MPRFNTYLVLLSLTVSPPPVRSFSLKMLNVQQSLKRFDTIETGEVGGPLLGDYGWSTSSQDFGLPSEKVQKRKT